MSQHRVGGITFHSTHKPYCDDPVTISRYEKGNETRPGASITMYGPCRKCEKCKLFRQLKWAERIKRETKLAPRSWLVTLTFSEIHLAGILMESKKMNYDTEQQCVEVAAYKHVQGYLKRVRKSCGSFRFVAVPEYGALKGRLHYHLLVHEIDIHSITYRTLCAKWRSFVGAELVRSAGGASGYVSKYLTKAIARPRASKRYGSETP